MSRSPHLWSFVVTARARDQLQGLLANDRRAVFQGISELLIADDPAFASGTRKMVDQEFEGLWRKRVGNYRLYFTIHIEQMVIDKFSYRGRVIVAGVFHRKDAY